MELIQVDLQGVNCYLLKNRNGFYLVDTGGHLTLDKTFTNRLESLENALNQYGVNENNLKLILLTHGDNDHACNAAYLRDKYHAKIAMHTGDKNLVEKPTIEDYMESYHYRSFLYRIIFRVMNKQIRKMTEKMLSDFKPFQPDIYLQHGMDLNEYGLDVLVLEAPGHSRGSVCFLTKEKELIVGDIFCNFKKPQLSPNAIDFMILKQTVRRLSQYEFVKVYPGHGTEFNYKSLTIN